MAINYKSLILENTEDTAKEIKKPVAKKKVEITYTIEGISGPDMVVTKKTPRKEEQFVMLMSQGQVYVKDMKSGSVTMYNADVVNNFFNNLEEPLECVDGEGHKLNWTDKFYRGMVFARTFCALVGVAGLKPYLNKSLFHIDLKDLKENEICDRTDHYDFKIMQTVYGIVPERLKQMYLDKLSCKLVSRYGGGYNRYNYNNGATDDNTKLESLIAYCCQKKYNPNKDVIDKKYGICGFTQFVEEYFQTAVSKFPEFDDLSNLFNGNAGYRYGHAKSKFEFDLKSLIKYIFYSSVEQGFATQIGNFMDMWTDTLVMADQIFKHGVEDKYPDNLATQHQILCYKYDLLKQKIDEEKWANQVEKMTKFERHGEIYSIICPKEPNDMIDEARQQSNCLSSYVNTVINGDCMIFFLRKTDEITKSLVTIEIHSDGTLGQVKAKYNHNPNPSEMDYVQKWYREKVSKLFNEEELATE